MDIKSKFNQAVDRLFRNNGNELDNTHINISDGTPLHSKGLVRLAHDKQTLILGILFLTTALLNKGNLWLPAAMTVVAIAHNIASRGGYNLVINTAYNKPYAGKSINKHPNDGQSTDSDLMRLAKEERNNCGIMTSISGTLSGLMLLPKNENVKASVSESFLGVPTENPYAVQFACASCIGIIASEFGLRAFRFHKVAKGDWVIESSPPSRKKPIPEKTTPFPVEILQPLRIER